MDSPEELQQAIRRRCPDDASVLVYQEDPDGFMVWQCPECPYFEFDAPKAEG